MKKCIIFPVLLILFSCQNANNSNNNGMNNGIDKRVLQIIDSLPLCPDVQNFATIYFTIDTMANTIIRVFNDVLIPPPPKPPEPYRKVLISETQGFKGYKKYNDRYVVFLQNSFNDKFDKFVAADSLQLDDEPFEKYGVYEYDFDRYIDCRGEEKIYRIAENDSLILLNRDNDNVFR